MDFVKPYKHKSFFPNLVMVGGCSLQTRRDKHMINSVNHNLPGHSVQIGIDDFGCRVIPDEDPLRRVGNRKLLVRQGGQSRRFRRHKCILVVVIAHRVV